MIFQENDFLKTYNEVDKLWESEDSKELYKKTFEDILSEANKFKSSRELNYDFWEAVQRLVWSKYKRTGKDDIPWYKRLVRSFYKPYLTESSILAKLCSENESNVDCVETLALDEANKLQLFFSGWAAADPNRDGLYSDYHKSLQTPLTADEIVSEVPDPDRVEVVPDFTVRLRKICLNDQELELNKDLRVEVKSKTADSDPHGAQLIMRYQTNYVKLVGNYWYELARGQDLTQTIVQFIKKSVPSLNYKKINEILAQPQNKQQYGVLMQNDGIKEILRDLESILIDIDTELRTRENGQNTKIIKRLETTSQNLINDADQLLKASTTEVHIPKPKLASAEDGRTSISPEQAARNLNLAAAYLASTVMVTSSSKEKENP